MDSSSSSHGLKDITNLRKVSSVAVGMPVNTEDKENADPRSILSLPASIVKQKSLLIEQKIPSGDEQPSHKQPQKPSEVEQQPPPKFEVVTMDQASDSSSDGFDVSDDLKLDEAADLDDDIITTITTKKAFEASEAGNDDVPSPLIMSSLLNNRVVFKLDDDDNGASPMFSQPQELRQERRKLDFSNMETNSTTASQSVNAGQKFLVRRCISMVERGQILQLNRSSPEGSENGGRRSTSSINDLTSPVARPYVSFKRPKEPLQPLNTNIESWPPSKKLRRGLSVGNQEDSPAFNKLMMTKSASTSGLDSPHIAKPMNQLSLSESEANIKKACSLADEPNLTGDRSRILALPTLPATERSKHNLKSIDCHAMADLLRGKFENQVASFRIIDARYCYEFKGGHIRGAENFGSWDEDAFFNEFLPKDLGPRPTIPDKEEKAKIIIFHCEFSSARGPALMTQLRNR
jgi:hypothetical protein